MIHQVRMYAAYDDRAAGGDTSKALVCMMGARSEVEAYITQNGGVLYSYAVVGGVLMDERFEGGRG